MNPAVPRQQPGWLTRARAFAGKNSIRRRLFVCFMILVILPLVFLGFISYFIATGALEKNITLNSSEMVDQVSQHLELYFRQYQQVSLSILWNQLARDFLAANKTDPDNLEPYMQGIRKYVFDPMITGKYEIEGLYLSGLDGWVTGINKTNEQGLLHDPHLLKKIGWLPKLPPDGSLLITGVQPVIVGHGQVGQSGQGQGPPVITLARRISPAGEPNKIMGIFWIDLNLQKIQDICEQVRLGKSGYISIIDSTGRVIFHPNANYIGGKYPKGFPGQIPTAASGHFLTRLEGVKSLVIYQTSPVTNWRLVAVVPYSEIAGGIYRLKNITIWVIILCGIACIIISGTFAASITQPIIRLQKTMEEAAKGYLDQSIPVDRTDEVGKLTENFNQMLQKIQTLISDNYSSRIHQAEAEAGQRHAELLALQAQINPHFLYNTLGTISSLAVLEGVDSISKMAGVLSDFFLYSIHTEEMLVTLGDELAQVERYFTIQKIRFGDRISLQLHIPENLLSHPVIKLTLQPLVENACIHGLEIYGHGEIMIGAQIDSGKLLISVTDTGAGIEETKLRELQHALDHPDGVPAANLFGIGLRNVHSRLKLEYGNDYGLQIQSRVGEGTTVIISIPFKSAPPTLVDPKKL